MNIDQPINWGTLRPLIAALTDAGVTMPKDATRALTTNDDVVLDMSRYALAPMGAELLDLTPADLIALVEHRALQVGLDQAVGNARGHVTEALANVAGTALRDHADDILGQLRSRFDIAADVVRAAYETGLRSDTRVQDVVGLSDAAVAAWRRLPEAVSVLDEAASIRTNMSLALGLAPQPDQASAAFCPAEGVWTGQRYGAGPSKWLALVPIGLGLNTIDQTRAAAARPLGPPIAPSNQALSDAWGGQVYVR